MNARSRRRPLRIAAGSAALIAALALSACGTTANNGGSDDPSGGKVLSSVEEIQLSDAQAEEIKSKKLTFGFLINNIADDFSTTLAESGKEWADKYGIELIVQSGDFDANKQLSQFNALVQQKVDGIFLTAVDASSIGTAVVKANQAGIPVFIVGGAPARGDVVSVMNAASYDGSREVTEALMKAIGKPNAKIAVLGIPFALQTIRDREKGVLDGVGAAGGQVISLQSDFSQDKLLALATNVIEANPDLDGIVATWSLADNAAIEAVKQSGRDIKIAGYDAEASGYQAFADGNTQLIALSGQQAYLQGRVAIEGLAQVVLGNSLAPEIITPNITVTKDNYADAWAKQYPSTDAPF